MTTSLTLAEVRAFIQVPISALSDDQLQVLLDGETANQARMCRVDPVIIEPTLDEALQRRVARAVAARGVPLGLLGDSGEYGPVAMRRFDGEIERIEQPWRRFVFG